MGLSHFPTASEGVLPLLVVNTVISVSLLKNMLRSVLNVDSSETNDSSDVEDHHTDENSARKRRISITQFKSLQQSREEENGNGNGNGDESGSSESRNNNNNNNKETEKGVVECCVCLCGFKEEEEVSELLSCKHFFHRSCLDKWFGNNKHTTCPLCRSIF